MARFIMPAWLTMGCKMARCHLFPNLWFDVATPFSGLTMTLSRPVFAVVLAMVVGFVTGAGEVKSWTR